MAKADLTKDYEVGIHIASANEYPEKWAQASLALREIEAAVGRARLNLAYGPNERQAFDLFYPCGQAHGLLVFVHGGYWHQFDRKSWSFLSKGATAAGWAVAIPSYTLAPQARLTEMVTEIATAITKAAEMVAGPIALAGHSAGGHLVARMNCQDVPLAPNVVARIKAIAAISPLSDLAPLMRTAMNETLGIDQAEAAIQSPVLAQNRHAIPAHIWVGAQERPVFLDHARGLADAWPEATHMIAPGRHHFDVIDALCDPSSPMLSRLLAD